MRTYQFQKALPVWLGDPQRMNTLEGFYVDCDYQDEEIALHLTASTFYRLFVNGTFVYAGPARCAKGFFRVDELPLNPWLQKGKNRIAIEVTSYHANSFAYLRQAGFLQAELLKNGQVIAATCDRTMPFLGFYLHQRVQKVPRYSYQRTFTEAYVLDTHTNDWRTDFSLKGEIPTQAQSGVLMQRGLPQHTFPATYATWYAMGSAMQCEKPCMMEPACRPHQNSYPISELTVRLHEEMFNFEFTAKEGAPEGKTVTLEAGSYVDGTFGLIKTGFFAMTLTAKAPTDVYLFFSEMQDKEGQVNPCRSGECVDAIKFTLTEAGRYDLRATEPYGGMVVRLITTAAEVTVEDMRIEAYAYPAPMGDPVQPKTEKLQAIYTAAKETFAQNASDIFMDCPTRERAGWLCDSFFEGRVEWVLNPEMCVERNFIENFQLPEYFECLPDGMLPMCYPSDHHLGGRHIPQWAMWFFLQVADYKKRGGDAELVASLQARYENLYRYFCQYENEFGLLEYLPSWNFVEWSFANELVCGMNYPTNMLYSAFLKVGAELYHKTELEEKAQKLIETIRARSFDGTYFRDHDERNASGVVEAKTDRTETCQYYAFYFGIATPETYPELWQKLTTVFGPDRDASAVESEIHQSNAFIGNYLRLEILRRYGLRDKMLQEIEKFFYGMSQRTGTLWEHMNEVHSCDHGFASYVIYLMKED